MILQRTPTLPKKVDVSCSFRLPGLKEAADYDAGLSPQSTFPAANVQREPKSPGDAKYRKIPLVKQDRQRSKKRQGKSKRRKNKRSGSSRGNKSNKDFERKMAASLRTARRADPDGPLYDATLDDDATSKQQLLGLGKPRHRSTSTQLTPFVSVGV